MSRYAAVFAFTAHGLARELHQNNALKPKALQSSQRAYQQPIASEPVRRFGHGHVPGATPMRSLSLAEIAALCDPGFNPLPILLSPAQILFNDWGPPQYDHVHCLIALNGSLCSRERAEAEARVDPSFDRTVILLDNIVEIGPTRQRHRCPSA